MNKPRRIRHLQSRRKQLVTQNLMHPLHRQSGSPTGTRPIDERAARRYRMQRRIKHPGTRRYWPV